jgi:hypothetical protein
VAHVLIVTALQFSHPVAGLVLMESGDSSCHVTAHSAGAVEGNALPYVMAMTILPTNARDA